jgi:hypothetical protein
MLRQFIASAGTPFESVAIRPDTDRIEQAGASTSGKQQGHKANNSQAKMMAHFKILDFI